MADPLTRPEPTEDQMWASMDEEECRNWNSGEGTPEQRQQFWEAKKAQCRRALAVMREPTIEEMLQTQHIDIIQTWNSALTPQHREQLLCAMKRDYWAKQKLPVVRLPPEPRPRSVSPLETTDTPKLDREIVVPQPKAEAKASKPEPLRAAISTDLTNIGSHFEFSEPVVAGSDQSKVEVLSDDPKRKQECGSDPSPSSAEPDHGESSPASRANPKLTSTERARNWLNRYAGWAFIGAATVMVGLGEYLVAEGLLLFALVAFVVQIHEWSSHIVRRWLVHVVKALWFAGALLLIVFFAIVLFKQMGSKPWSNLMSGGISTATPAPSVTPTPGASPSPSPVSSAASTQQSPKGSLKGKREKDRILHNLYSNGNNAHAGVMQRGKRITLQGLKRALSEKLTKNGLSIVLKEVQQFGVAFTLTPQIEKEIRDIAANHNNESIDPLIAAIRKNDWRQSDEAKQLIEQIINELVGLIDEGRVIDFTYYEAVIEAFNNWSEKCSVSVGKIDGQMRGFRDTDYQTDWTRGKHIWWKLKLGKNEVEDKELLRQEREGAIYHLNSFRDRIPKDVRPE